MASRKLDFHDWRSTPDLQFISLKFSLPDMEKLQATIYDNFFLLEFHYLFG